MTETKRPLGGTFVTMTRIMGRSDCLKLIEELTQSSQSELIRDFKLNEIYPTDEYERVAVFLGESHQTEFIFRISRRVLGTSTLTCHFELKPMCGMDTLEDYISSDMVVDIEKRMIEKFHQYCQNICEDLDSDDWNPTGIKYVIPIRSEELAIAPIQYMELILRGRLVYPSFALQYYRCGDTTSIDAEPGRLEFSYQDNYSESIYRIYALQQEVRVPNERGPLVQREMLVFEVEHKFKELFCDGCLSDEASEDTILNYYSGMVGNGPFCKLEENLRRVDQARLYGADPAPGDDREVGVVADTRLNMKRVLRLMDRYGSICALFANPDNYSCDIEEIHNGFAALDAYNINPISLPEKWTVDVVPSPFESLR